MKILFASFISLAAGTVAVLLTVSLYYLTPDTFVVDPANRAANIPIDLTPRRDSPYSLTLSKKGKALGLFPVQEFYSGDFPFFSLHLDNYGAVDRIRLVWRNEDVGQPYFYILPNAPRKEMAVFTAALPDWQGEIRELGILIEGDPEARVNIAQASLQPWSQGNLLMALADSWMAFTFWRPASINFFQATDIQGSPFTQVSLAALWMGFSLAILLLLRLVLSLDRAATWAGAGGIVIASWLVIDVSWQRAMLIQLQHTRADYEDKSRWHRSFIDTNAAVKRMSNSMLAHITEADARIFVNSDSEYTAMRAAYDFYPSNVYWNRKKAGYLPAEYTRTGDYIALIEPTSIKFRQNTMDLLATSGDPVPVNPIWTSALGALYRVR